MFSKDWFKRTASGGYDPTNISAAFYLGAPDVAKYRLFLLSATSPGLISFGASGTATGRIGMILDGNMQDNQIYWYDGSTPRSLQQYPSGFSCYNDRIMGLEWNQGSVGWSAPDIGYGNGTASLKSDGISTLYPGEKLISNNGNFTFVVQTDFNLVIYDRNNNVIWAAGSMGRNFDRFCLNTNGEFCAFKNPGDFASTVWKSGKWQDGGGVFTATLQDDGNLVANGRDGKYMWGSTQFKGNLT